MQGVKYLNRVNSHMRLFGMCAADFSSQAVPQVRISAHSICVPGDDHRHANTCSRHSIVNIYISYCTGQVSACEAPATSTNDSRPSCYKPPGIRPFFTSRVAIPGQLVLVVRCACIIASHAAVSASNVSRQSHQQGTEERTVFGSNQAKLSCRLSVQSCDSLRCY